MTDMVSINTTKERVNIEVGDVTFSINTDREGNRLLALISFIIGATIGLQDEYRGSYRVIHNHGNAMFMIDGCDNKSLGFLHIMDNKYLIVVSETIEETPDETEYQNRFIACTNELQLKVFRVYIDDWIMN